MSKTIRSACRNKHSEDYVGFIAASCGKDVSERIKTIQSSKRYHKAYRSGDGEAQASYEEKIDDLLRGATISWCDRRSLTDKLNKTPHLYYVAVHIFYEDDIDEKYFLKEDKALMYAHELRKKYKDSLNDEGRMCLVTDILPFSD